MWLRILVSPMVAFGIALFTTAMFNDYVKTWEVKNALPIFMAALAGWLLASLGHRKKSEKKLK